MEQKLIWLDHKTTSYGKRKTKISSKTINRE